MFLPHALVMEKDDAPTPALTVLYDGSCPLCRREISVYRGLQSSQPVDWLDVSAVDAALPGCENRDALMARFHVQQADGTVISGAKAFLALWATLPGWRWLAALGRLPGATPCLEWLYCRFLAVRPWLQRKAVALENRHAGRRHG
jgi:3-demethoxyubiquinol 3-hydroxylase